MPLALIISSPIIRALCPDMSIPFSAAAITAYSVAGLPVRACVPAEETFTPCISFNRARRIPSAIGLLHIFPVHTTKIFLDLAMDFIKGSQ
jgi:hypothetical protein